jgi:hypothetical protein
MITKPIEFSNRSHKAWPPRCAWQSAVAEVDGRLRSYGGNNFVQSQEEKTPEGGLLRDFVCQDFGEFRTHCYGNTSRCWNNQPVRENSLCLSFYRHLDALGHCPFTMLSTVRIHDLMRALWSMMIDDGLKLGLVSISVKSFQASPSS